MKNLILDSILLDMNDIRVTFLGNTFTRNIVKETATDLILLDENVHNFYRIWQDIDEYCIELENEEI